AAPDVPRTGYLVVSALVPYKRVDLAVRLATERRLPLTVIGDGPERQRLLHLAGPTVRFLRHLTREEIRDAYARARALLFCGIEDFGITPVEAMAAGCPVVALLGGGACETVLGEGGSPTGVFFAEPTVLALEAARVRLEYHLAHGALPRSRLLAQARR